MSRSPEILIATNSDDEVNYRPVVEKLADEYGYEPVVFQADKVVSGSHGFTLHFSAEDGFTTNYNGRHIQPAQLAAAWYRRPNAFGLDGMAPLLSFALADQYRAMQEALWRQIPDEVWLNAPSRMRMAGEKISQLALAVEAGFAVPETVITNSWDDVTRLKADELIAKPVDLSPAYTDATGMVVFASRLPNDIEQLPTSSTPYPAIWQAYAPKQREWRVTVVGDDVFPAAIYTSEVARADWRQHQMTGAVEFKREPFPEAASEKCRRILGRYGLTFGAFDLVETPDGELVFLELNPNGQFMFVEHKLGLPISGAIASELARTARQTA